MRWLVVDDDRDILALFDAVLSVRGHDVSLHSDPLEALAEYRASPFALVVLDWLMPQMDGLELCRKIRALPGGDRSTILVVTSRGDPDALDEVLSADADDYLQKPIDPHLLDVRLSIAERAAHNRLERKRAEESLRQSRDDLQSVLNQLRLGTVIADAAGTASFFSRAAERLLGCSSTDHARWLDAPALDDRARAAIGAMADQHPTDRSKLPVLLGESGAAAEVEINDHPRNEGRKFFFFYDVSDVQTLRRKLDGTARCDDLVGKSASMRAVYQMIRDVSEVNSTVLILGETGTGKELVARAIHGASPRAQRPMIPVNCAGLTESILTSQLFGHRRGAFTGADSDREGLFEAASGGTIFLDELGDIPMTVQTTLLRVLQEREITRVGETRPRKIDVRVVAATHRDLKDEVAAGRFRQDLLYRLRVVTVRLPPLRERLEDVPPLVDALLVDLRAETGKSVEGVGHETMRVLMAHDWPGNVRELKSVLESALIRCRGTQIQPEDLPADVFESISGEPLVTGDGQERQLIVDALERASGNRSAAARLLGISRATLYRRLNVLDIRDEQS